MLLFPIRRLAYIVICETEIPVLQKCKLCNECSETSPIQSRKIIQIVFNIRSACTL